MVPTKSSLWQGRPYKEPFESRHQRLNAWFVKHNKKEDEVYKHRQAEMTSIFIVCLTKQSVDLAVRVVLTNALSDTIDKNHPLEPRRRGR